MLFTLLLNAGSTQSATANNLYASFDPAIPATAPAVIHVAEVVQTTSPVVTPAATVAATPAVQQTLTSWSAYLEALAIICAALGTLWLLVWLLKRGSRMLGSAKAPMTIEHRLSLGTKKSLLITRVLGKRMLIGVTESQITLLTELPDDEQQGMTAPNPDSGPVNIAVQAAPAAQESFDAFLHYTANGKNNG